MDQPNRLAALIRNRRADVLAAWEASVRTLASAASAPSVLLLNHVPDYLDWLADRLSAPADAPEGPRDAFIFRHAEDRFEQGFDLVEVLSELALLRDAVLGAWEAEPEGVAPGDVRRANEELDHVMTLVAIEYVRAAAPEALDAGAGEDAAAVAVP